MKFVYLAAVVAPVLAATDIGIAGLPKNLPKDAYLDTTSPAGQDVLTANLYGMTYYYNTNYMNWLTSNMDPEQAAIYTSLFPVDNVDGVHTVGEDLAAFTDFTATAAAGDGTGPPRLTDGQNTDDKDGPKTTGNAPPANAESTGKDKPQDDKGSSSVPPSEQKPNSSKDGASGIGIGAGALAFALLLV
ncbi:hypothetical protein DICA1_E13366 [Diutina catenulata]